MFLRHLLSDEVWGMGSLHLEGAVLGPQVNRVGDACTTSLVDLEKGVLAMRYRLFWNCWPTHHLCGFGAGDIELLIGILLPVAEQKRELEKEAVVSVAEGRNSLGARVPIQRAVHLTRADKLLPGLEAVGIGVLRKTRRLTTGQIGDGSWARREETYHVSPKSLDLGVLLIRGAKVAEVRHGDGGSATTGTGGYELWRWNGAAHGIVDGC